MGDNDNEGSSGTTPSSTGKKTMLSKDQIIHLSDLVAGGVGAMFSSAGVSSVRPWRQGLESVVISIIARFLSSSVDASKWTDMSSRDKNSMVVAVLGALAGSFGSRRPFASALVALSADLIADEVTQLISKTGDGSML